MNVHVYYMHTYNVYYVPHIILICKLHCALLDWSVCLLVLNIGVNWQNCTSSIVQFQILHIGRYYTQPYAEYTLEYTQSYSLATFALFLLLLLTFCAHVHEGQLRYSVCVCVCVCVCVRCLQAAYRVCTTN